MKFAIGEKAMLIHPWREQHTCGVEIVTLHGTRYPDWVATDYAVKCSCPGFKHWAVNEDQLVKLPGDSIPASTLALFTKKQPNPDKVKEKA